MDELTRHCMELLSPLGLVRSRRMFGGVGLYADDVFVALIVNDQLYLKTDEVTRPRFEAAGCEPFRYRKKDGESVSVSYFRPPEEAMESSALMLPWARLAMEAALRARNAPVKKRVPAKPAAKAKAKPKTTAR